MAMLKLIVGLGNPGPRYAATRHNIGASWVRQLAARYGINLYLETKFKGELGYGQMAGAALRLLVPDTFMNNSGDSVGALARYYKIAPEEMLVAYDEMAFAPGVVRLKAGGGDNGHNGLKSVRAGCGNNGNFHRLRIGVGHPGDKGLVTAYLTQHTMPADQRALAEQALDMPESLVKDMVQMNWQAAMNVLHATGDK